MEVKRDKATEQVRSMNQYEAADYLLKLRNPVDRVKQGLEWISGSGHPLNQSLAVASIVLSNTHQVLAELELLKAQQAQKPQPADPKT